MSVFSRMPGPATRETGRCPATRNPGVWPYVSRCTLEPHEGDQSHADRHGRWWDEAVADAELPTGFTESNALLLVLGGREAQAGRILAGMTSSELRDLAEACTTVATMCVTQATTRVTESTP